MQDQHPLAPMLPNHAAVCDLAARAGCSASHIMNIRAGRKSASLALAARLAKETGLPMDAFLRAEGGQ